MEALMRHVATAIALILVTLPAPAAGQQTALTDAQIRSAEIEVPRLAALLGLQPGMTVGDVGAGFGAWTVRLARVVGPTGRVFATDLGEAQLAALRTYAAREGQSHVVVVEGSAQSTNLPPLCCDAILVRDAYHHFTHPEEMVRSLMAALKPGGRLAIIDFPPRPATEVPPGVPADRMGHGVPPAVVEREAGAALVHERTELDWSPESQPASLFLVLFRKP
jgi:ubiquinone/menaquinone biosynthesis C-methylase UbiE